MGGVSLLNDWSGRVRVRAMSRATVRVSIFRVGQYSDTFFTPGQLNSCFTFNSCYPVCEMGMGNMRTVRLRPVRLGLVEISAFMLPE